MFNLYRYLVNNHMNKHHYANNGKGIYLNDTEYPVFIGRDWSAFSTVDADGEAVGGNAYEYLTEYLEMSGKKAHDIIYGIDSQIQDKSNSLVDGPKAYGNNRLAIDYLCCKRYLDKSLIEKLIKLDLIYIAYDYCQAVVFINSDKDWGCMRGRLNKVFHKVLKDSRSDGYWSFNAGRNIKKAYVCKGCIDAISLYQLLNFESAYYIAIGIYEVYNRQGTIERIKQFCKQRGLECWLALDNSPVGDKCRAKNPDLKVIRPKGLDWNVDLIQNIVNDRA